MKPQLVYSLLLVITTTVAIAPPICAVESESIPPTPLDKGGTALSPTPLNKGGVAGGGISGFVAQQSSITQVTDVQLQQTDKGLKVILETADGKSLQVFPTSFSKTFVANIPNAQLAQGKTLRQENPASGIASIAVTQQGTNNIRVTVTGTRDLLKVEVERSDRALTLTLPNALAPTAQQPTPVLPAAKPPVSETNPEVTTPHSEAPPQEGEAQQPTTTTEGEEQEIVVTGEQETGYSVPNATTATKTDTPLRDIPQSIQVVPRQVLEDQQVIRVGDALQNVSGVNNLGGYEGFEEFLKIRGLTVNAFQGDYFRDGIRLFTSGFLETANLERIEVLKGPASVLFGQAQPGGIINLVTKQPLRDPYFSPSITIGNYSTYRGSLDLSGSLNESKNLLYRLNTYYENAGSFRDFVNSERLFVAPVFRWEISANTSLNLDAEFLDDSRTADDGIVAFGDGVVDVPRSRFLGEPFSQFDKEEFSIGYVFNHRFHENLSIRNSFRAQLTDTERYYPIPDSFDEATGELNRIKYYSPARTENFATQTDLIGKFATGSIQHQVLVGFEYGKTVEKFEFGDFEPYTSINVFNPVYTRERYPKEEILNFFRDDITKTLGFYLQDQIDLTSNLKFLIGGRFDSFDQTRTTRNLGEPRQEFEQTDSKFSPRVGIVYQPSDTVSLYASYTSSFKPAFGESRDANDEPFEPEEGRQFEIGIKTDFDDGRLNATLAAFDITKQNVTTADPDNPDFSIQTGEQTSRGIELDVAGEILPGWNIIASAAYINAYISEDNTYEVGNRLDNAPEFSSSLWTTYEIQKGNLQGLGFGLGLYYVGDRQGDLDNSYVLPDYFRTDAAIYYRHNNWRAALNIKNLFDVEYFAGSDNSRNQIQPGAPFTILGSFSLEF